jgi:hypothetical protein
MDTNQILLTAGVGLVASLVTALVTNVFARRQERQKSALTQELERQKSAYIRELERQKNEFTQALERQRNEFAEAQEHRRSEHAVADKLAALNSTDPVASQIYATQFAQGCLLVERGGGVDRQRVLIPKGSRLSLGRGIDNNIVVDDDFLSKLHATFVAHGGDVYIEPLGGGKTLGVMESKPQSGRSVASSMRSRRFLRRTA